MRPNPFQGANNARYVVGMHAHLPRLVVLGAFILVNIVGVVAFFAAGSVARHLDPAADEHHLVAFMVAIVGVAVAIGSAFPIFVHGVPWATARLASRFQDLSITSSRPGASHGPF